MESFTENRGGETARIGIKLYRIYRRYYKKREGIIELILTFYLEDERKMLKIMYDNNKIYIFSKNKIVEIDEKTMGRKIIIIKERGKDIETNMVLNIVKNKFIINKCSKEFNIKDNYKTQYSYEIITFPKDLMRKYKYVNGLERYPDSFVCLDEKEKYHIFISYNSKNKKHIILDLPDKSKYKILYVELLKITEDMILFSVRIALIKKFRADILYYFNRETNSIVSFKLLDFTKVDENELYKITNKFWFFKDTHITEDELIFEYDNGSFASLCINDLVKSHI